MLKDLIRGRSYQKRCIRLVMLKYLKRHPGCTGCGLTPLNARDAGRDLFGRKDSLKLFIGVSLDLWSVD